MTRHERELAIDGVELAERLSDLAEAWGGEWTPAAGGGRLALPVVFGLRRGELSGPVAILLLAALPTVGSLAWPFFPRLFALVPYAAVFGLLAWWLVVSRLRSHGPEEFLAALAAPPPATRESTDVPIR